jgi:hypothetical protein
MRFLPQILILWLLVTVEGSAAPRSNEFTTSNDNTLAGEDGEFSDWVEIYNPDETSYDLSGCYLTDDDGVRTMWRFPAGTQIDVKGFLVVLPPIRIA